MPLQHERNETMAEWTWGNDTPVWLTPRRTGYFIFRRIDGKAEFLTDKRGRMRRCYSQNAVKAALAKFTCKVQPQAARNTDNTSTG